MATTIYNVELTDSPNSGRVKINTNFTNLKATADNTAVLLAGIGDPIGTTNVAELTNKTITSDNIDGAKNNVISVSRLDINDDIFTVSSDYGSLSVGIDDVSIYDLDVLGTNGLDTYVSGGKLYIRNSQYASMNMANQTLAIAVSGVVTGYTLDVNGYGLIRNGLSVGTHASLSTDQLHVSATDNANPVVTTIKNLGTAAAPPTPICLLAFTSKVCVPDIINLIELAEC